MRSSKGNIGYRRGKGQIQSKGFLLWAGLCLIVAILPGWWKTGSGSAAAAAYSLQSQAAAGNVQQLKSAVPLLLSMGERVIMPGSSQRLVLKWQGEAKHNAAQAAEAARKLSAGLGLGKVYTAKEDGHLSSRAAAINGSGVKISLFQSQLEEERSYTIITIDTHHLQDPAEFQRQAEAAGMIMEQSGISAQWNASLQGTSAQQGEPQEALDFAQESLSDVLPGMAAEESYQDMTTSSRSYGVAELANSVQSGNHRIAMQAAVHHNGNNGSNRITIGLPLITIEY